MKEKTGFVIGGDELGQGTKHEETDVTPAYSRGPKPPHVSYRIEDLNHEQLIELRRRLDKAKEDKQD